MLERDGIAQKVFRIGLLICSCYLLWGAAAVSAYEILGIGTNALVGNDLTDLDGDGDPELEEGYDAIFDSNDEPGFGGGEFSFNVFDNRLGPSNDKWCCGPGGGIPEEGLWVSAQLSGPHVLTSFTVSSANDVPSRDPISWAVQGSNDGQDFTDIYVYEEGISPWDARLQVAEFVAGEDFPLQTQAYEHFRFVTYDTAANPNGAYYQVGEIEYFGRSGAGADGTPARFVAGAGRIGQKVLVGERSNEMFGPEQGGVPGWSVRLVDTDVTVDSHTVAEDVLDDPDEESVIGSYSVVDLAGGGGTFPVNNPYPNGVADTSMEDFAVRAEAEVVIPAGTWTIGFGSDDGGQLTIPGVEFTDFLNNDSFDDDQIRFEGNRGHGWTVGTFTLAEPLTTTITASFHERGGGDSFEIAVIDEDVLEGADPGFGWELLGDDTFGWDVTHTASPLVSADLTAALVSNLPVEIDVDGDSDTADVIAVENPDPNIFTTILDIDGVTFQISGSGTFANGDTFDIIAADQIVGTPTITSLNPAQTWDFDPSTGQICFGSCPGGLEGDYDGDGTLDIDDLNLQATAIQNNDSSFDLDGDGDTDFDDRRTWVKDLKQTWVGDANLDGEFSSADFVAVFQVGKFEQEVDATWAEGDWNGDGRFGSGDFVAAFQDGGFEQGPLPVAAVSAVPEPSGIVLALVGLLGLLRVVRRSRNR